ncbi:hypothetical protein V6Z98_005445 [Aspergillus fumigatus]
MRLRCPSPTRSPAYEPWFWNIHWRQGETEEDSLGNQVWWLVGRALDLVYGKGELFGYYSSPHEAENWYASLSECFSIRIVQVYHIHTLKDPPSSRALEAK